MSSAPPCSHSTTLSHHKYISVYVCDCMWTWLCPAIFICCCKIIITTPSQCLRWCICTCVCAWDVDVPATQTSSKLRIQHQPLFILQQLKFLRANESLRIYWTSIVSQMARSIIVKISHQREGSLSAMNR